MLQEGTQKAEVNNLTHDTKRTALMKRTGGSRV